MFVSEPAAQTCFFVAIVVFELHESLRISCRLDGDASCLPHAGDMVVFSPYLVKQRDGAFAPLLLAEMAPVGEKYGDGCVDNEQLQ